MLTMGVLRPGSQVHCERGKHFHWFSFRRAEGADWLAAHLKRVENAFGQRAIESGSLPG